MGCLFGAGNFDSIKSRSRSVKPSPAALIRAALKWVRVLSSLTKKKRHPLGASSFGADDRTRTCTLARWNLNPMSLPIPPHPHIHFLCLQDPSQDGCEIRKCRGHKVNDRTDPGNLQVIDSHAKPGSSEASLCPGHFKHTGKNTAEITDHSNTIHQCAEDFCQHNRFVKYRPFMPLHNNTFLYVDLF